LSEIIRLVMLRRPGAKGPHDMRTDPFWEFGSFGLTGCHARNLMHLRNAELLDGTRLAFIQGGVDAIKLLLLTPPIRMITHRRRCEARWPAGSLPYRYEDAQLIIDNDGRTDFPRLKNLTSGVNRSTWMGKIASAFRTRVRPLPADVANELISVFRSRGKDGNKVITTYIDALPFPPPAIDHNRASTYRELLEHA